MYEELKRWHSGNIEKKMCGDERAARITTGNHTRKALAAVSADFRTQRPPPKSPPPSSP